ncbi:TPA: DUF362 domain-containing protein [Methanosarcina acetivorans]|uniref:DUF362 domain-containing protein n=2 Tax=Methanosarcina acetivorans TaxID=2214 RepID=Q8TTQ9_METAC|nr:DUF362 domain-containing protein [Methanosarcina acetivorans]AAM03819.1 conserved hypothetical protein [Methanosarcina acetivorans C2A]HIH93327.1 DUF362 domain-containing protein [Methanosarcina acetivorans]
MKRHFAILLASLLMFFLIAGCVTNESNNTKSNISENVSEPSIVDSVSGEESQAMAAPESVADGAPQVYMTTDISPEGLMAVYEALGRNVTGNVAVKISTGEPGGHNYLSPDLIKDLVQSVNGTIVECNTAYGGRRAETAMHKQVMIDHGFTAIAPTDIMDEEGEISLSVPVGQHLDEFIVGSHFENYDSWLILSHFKGHAMGGFGGALKNVAIGIASPNGKSYVHTAGRTNVVEQMWAEISETPQDEFLESMAEANGAFMNEVGDNVVYINVLNRLSVDCDCDSSPAEPTMADIGIMASLDPVALDQASVDQIYAAPNGQDLIERMESRNGTHILDYADGLGLGSQEYELVMLDA